MAITYEEVWGLMHALIASQKETEQLLKQQAQESDHRFQETDRRFQETEQLLKQQAQEADRRFQETEQLLKQQAQEADHRFQETERLWKQQSQDTDRKIQEVSKQIGRLGNRLGDFVEEMVRPSLVRLFQARGLAVHHVLRSIVAYDDQHRIQSEVDLVVSNTTVAIVVECKSQLSIDDVNDHIKRLKAIKTNFPQYVGKQILGAVAAMVMPENVSKYAISKGLFLLVQSGEAIIIDNTATFVPAQW